MGLIVFVFVCANVGTGGLVSLIIGAMDMNMERTAQALFMEANGTTSTVMTSLVLSAREQ